MAKIDLRGLQENLSKGEISPVYLLFGEEPYLIEESLNVIKKTVLDQGAVDFNFDQFYAGETVAAQVLDAVELLPMMCPRRLVFYKGVDQLKEKDWEALLPVLAEPVSSSTFVLVAEKADKRKKYFKTIQTNGCVVELTTPYDNHIPQWIQYMASQYQLQLQPDAIRLIHNLVGGQLSDINQELKKLSQFLGDRSMATAEDVKSVVSQSKVHSVFDLVNAIGEGHLAIALECIKNLLEYGQSEVGAVVLITRHIRKLQKIYEMKRSNTPSNQYSTVLGVPPFFVKQYVGQAKKWSEAKLSKTIELLFEMDKDLKQSNLPSDILLQNFVIKICQ